MCCANSEEAFPEKIIMLDMCEGLQSELFLIMNRNMAGVLGFEPRYAGIKTLCLNHLATPQKHVTCDVTKGVGILKAFIVIVNGFPSV